eukprot:6198169-Pleurochrysis_carterae.AAC.2
MAATLQLSPQIQLAKLLGSSARLFVTRAVVAELRALGKEYKAATAAAKRLPKLDGGSSQAGAAADSVRAITRFPAHLNAIVAPLHSLARPLPPFPPLTSFSRASLRLPRVLTLAHSCPRSNMLSHAFARLLTGFRALLCPRTPSRALARLRTPS